MKLTTQCAALVRVAEPIALTSILPYAWKLVLHFEISDKSDASFYAGLLIAAFALAESLTGMFWGALSDRLGRKPVLIMGCFGTIASLLVVGFAPTFSIAIAGRLIGGALNGNIGVIQTMVGELVVNPEHEPKAYAIMPFVWSVGTILGPCIGGLAAEPATRFPDTLGKIAVFRQFPYLLPNLICALLMLVSIIAGWLFLEETHPDMQAWSIPRDIENTNPPHLPTQAGSDTAPADLTHESYGTFNDVTEEAVDEEVFVNPDGSSRPASIRKSPTRTAFTRPVVMLIVALGIFTYHSMTYDHLLPIFLQDGRAPSESSFMSAIMSTSASSMGSFAGGLGLSVKDVGVIMSINGLIALFIQAVIFPIMASWLGIWKVFVLVTIGHPIAYFIVPWLVFLPTGLLYPGIFACMAIRNLFGILAYPVLLILIKEASPDPKSLGKINGLAASTGAACRTIASPVAGLLYGVGINIDFTALAWWSSALVAVIGTVQAFFITRETRGPQHYIRPAVSFSHDTTTRGRKSSVVHIRVCRVDSDGGSTDESQPLIRARGSRVDS